MEKKRMKRKRRMSFSTLGDFGLRISGLSCFGN
jgi:hypothetical protein